MSSHHLYSLIINTKHAVSLLQSPFTTPNQKSNQTDVTTGKNILQNKVF